MACSLDRDCAEPYVCAFDSCRARCRSAADCADGGACITDDNQNAVCQDASDKNTPCNAQQDCRAPLACATDFRCRNLCTTDDDCNTSGIVGRVCVKDDNDVYFCADQSEASDGGLSAEPAPGHRGQVQPPYSRPDTGNGGQGGQSSGGVSTAGSDGKPISGTGGAAAGSAATTARRAGWDFHLPGTTHGERVEPGAPGYRPRQRVRRVRSVLGPLYRRIRIQRALVQPEGQRWPEPEAAAASRSRRAVTRASTSR
jgi:hypothetical protein